MKISDLKNSITDLSGIGKASAALFANLNIYTIADLLKFYPKDYEDRTQKVTLSQTLHLTKDHSTKAHTIAKVIDHQWFGFGRMKTLKLIITDGTANAELIAFNRSFLEKSFPIGSIIAVTGRFEIKYNKLQCTQFDLSKIASDGELELYFDKPVPDSKVYPIYHLTEGLTQKAVYKAIDAALKQYTIGIEDELSDSIIKSRNLISKSEAIKKIHQPDNLKQAFEARNTLIYEELYQFEYIIAKRAYKHRGYIPEDINGLSQTQKKVSKDDFIKALSPKQRQLLTRLPFDLTEDQMSVIAHLNKDLDENFDRTNQVKETPFSMRTLIQGDVGSGKTLVSFFAILRVIDYGSQCALMAPTEILAKQHAESAAAQLEAIGVRVAYLTGNINTKGRAALLEALKKGNVDLVVGTHALFSKNIEYNDLSLIIIDEQHRFGVMQRSAIIDKGRKSLKPKSCEPNLIMMSATPIPQTLALTVFGDLDILTIHTMPQGRKAIKTYLVRAGNEANAYEEVRKELIRGHQAYFVYPAIENNMSDDSETKAVLKSAQEMHDFLSKEVYPGFNIGLIHSKIDEDEQSRILQDFKNNKIQILVATTVVEVGVDVPNATCMVIEQADRFGLAALHQLRGRVGRGKDQSYCFLIYSKNITETGVERMKALHESTDGFILAEEDLKLRGPGEINGTVQSGELTFAIADVTRDRDTMLNARLDAYNTLRREIEQTN